MVSVVSDISESDDKYFGKKFSNIYNTVRTPYCTIDSFETTKKAQHEAVDGIATVQYCSIQELLYTKVLSENKTCAPYMLKSERCRMQRFSRITLAISYD
jgi:hypothetical protein